MAKDERETKDNSSKWYERRNRVAPVEDEQTDKDEYQQRNSDHHCVEFRYSGPDVLETGCKGFPFSIDSTNGFAHFRFRDITISVFIEQGERGSLGGGAYQ